MPQLRAWGSLVRMGCQLQESGTWLRELEVCKLQVPAQSTVCTTPSRCVQLLDCIVGPTIPEPPPAENKGIFTVPSVTRVPERMMMTCLDACGKSTSEMSKSPFAGFPLSSTLGYLGCLFGGVTQTFVPKVMVVVVSLAHSRSLLLSHC